jgi:hypothetical protein
VLLAVTGLINAEEQLVNAVFEDLSSATHGFGRIRHEVRELIAIDGGLTRDLTHLANQGLASDPLFQQDLTTLVGIESELTQILSQLHPTHSD